MTRKSLSKLLISAIAGVLFLEKGDRSILA